MCTELAENLDKAHKKIESLTQELIVKLDDIKRRD